MPQLLRVGPYTIYFWSNESEPLEPVHVHIADGKPTRDATKIWITATGRALLCHNKSKTRARFEQIAACRRGECGGICTRMARPFRRDRLLLLILAREIVKRIEKEMEYPGQIKVNVIRETRAVEFAK